MAVSPSKIESSVYSFIFEFIHRPPRSPGTRDQGGETHEPTQSRVMVKKEAAQVAKRRTCDKAATQMECQKAKDVMERQQKAAAAVVIVPKIVAVPPKVEHIVKAVAEPVVKEAPVTLKKITSNPFSIFGGDEPAEKKVAPAKPVAEKKGKAVVTFASPHRYCVHPPRRFCFFLLNKLSRSLLTSNLSCRLQPRKWNLRPKCLRPSLAPNPM